MDVDPLLVPNTQAAKLIQPSESALDNPSPSSKATTMFCVAFSEKGDDISRAQVVPDRLGVISTISREAIRTTTRPTSFSLQSRNGINKCKCLLRVVAIRSG
jgi:hypothetical protein